MAATKSQGTTITVDTTTIGCVTGFSGPGGSAAVIDATCLASTAKEKILGLSDEGQWTIDVNYLDDAGQDALVVHKQAGTAGAFVITFADTSTATFSALVLSYPVSGGVDDKVSRSFTLEITGAVTWA